MKFDWWRRAGEGEGGSTDQGLQVAVASFREALVPVLQPLMAETPGMTASHAEHDVVLEAFNLSCAFIDADGLATDDELWSLLATFGAILDRRYAEMTPEAARRVGLTEGKRWYLDTPSPMFELIVGLDARTGSDHATTYLRHAVAIGHMVASLDSLTSRTELEAIESFRARLLGRIKGVGSRRPDEPTPVGSASPPDASGTTSLHVEGGTEGEAVAPVEELPPPRPLEELLDELDGLIGLAEVKHEVRLIVDLLRVQELRAARGLSSVERSHHLVFTGNPGTGKTTVARLVAQIFRTLGVVARGQLVETDRAGLVAGYVGQTATKVKERFDEADGGVLLIDEAYSLVRGTETDFGREAIDMIVKLVEDRRDRVVVIMAGYTGEMEQLVAANPGLASRFPTTVHFPDYADEELVAIFVSMAEANHYLVPTETQAVLLAWFALQPRDQGFGNGRLDRNLFEAAVSRQASRVASSMTGVEAISGRELVPLSPGGGPALDG